MPIKRHPQADSTPRKVVDNSTNSGGSAPSGSGRNKKVSTSSAPSRTGQACDRCKTRKIRCDNTPGGCLPCRQNNTECKTTDRITHRATARGHTEALEQQNFLLSQRIRFLEQQVADLGGKPKTHPYYGGSSSQRASRDTTSSASITGQPWPPESSAGRESSSTRPGSDQGDTFSSNASVSEDNIFVLPLRPAEESPERRMGLSAFRSGTSLSLFEMHIDLAEFMIDAGNDPHGPRSYTKLFEIITLGTRHGSDLLKAETPATYEECMQYIELYLSTGNNFQPVLHPPKLKDIVFRIYHQSYQMTHAESAILHCILAWIKFQVAARDTTSQKQNLNAESDTHYHYALSHLHYLIMGRTLEDIQAMTLICLHVRNFPDSSTAWITLHRALTNIVEAGFHRKMGPWPPNATKEEIRIMETRKRVFWVLFSMMTSISGKMGRPMPIRVDDFDVEMPEALTENLERVETGREPEHCSYFFALQLFKLVRITNEIYNTIYAVRPTQPYDQALRRFEQDLEEFKEQMPYCLTEEVAVTPTQDRNRILALWIQRQYSEVRLVLHHPALCRSASPDTVTRNLSMAIDAAYQVIRFSAELCALNGLDTTWYNTTALIASIFLLLYAAEKRGHNNQEDMLKLQNVMRDCLTMCGSIGEMLGTGLRLRNKMAGIITKAFERIAESQSQKGPNVSATITKQSPNASPNPASGFKQAEPATLNVQTSTGLTREEEPDMANSAHIAAFTGQNHKPPSSMSQPQTQPGLVNPVTHFSYPYSTQGGFYQDQVSTIGQVGGNRAYADPQLAESGPTEWQRWALMACEQRPLVQQAQAGTQQFVNNLQVTGLENQGHVPPPPSGNEVVTQQIAQPAANAPNPLLYGESTIPGPGHLDQTLSNLVPTENMSLAASVNRRGWPLATWTTYS